MSLEYLNIDLWIEEKIDNLIWQAENYIQWLRWKSKREQQIFLEWDSFNTNYKDILESIFSKKLLPDNNSIISRLRVAVNSIGEKIWVFLLLDFLFTEWFFIDNPTLKEEVWQILFEFWEVTENLEYTNNIKNLIASYKNKTRKILRIESYDIKIEWFISAVLKKESDPMLISNLFSYCVEIWVFENNEFIDYADIHTYWKIWVSVLFRRILKNKDIKIFPQIKNKMEQFINWIEKDWVITTEIQSLIEIEFICNTYKINDISDRYIKMLLKAFTSWLLDNNDIIYQRVLNILWEQEHNLTEEEVKLFYNYLSEVYEITPLPHSSSPS